MRKLLVMLAMMALVALTTVAPALATGGGFNGSIGQQLFFALGTITALDDGDALTVHVLEGSRLIWPSIGQRLTVHMSPDTLFFRRTPNGLGPSPMAM